MRLTFAQANQRTRTSGSIIVRLQTAAGTIGYGESCPRTYVSGESSEGVFRSLHQVQQQLFSQTFEDFAAIRNWVLQLLDSGTGPAAVCALELALIDAWCKEQQAALLELLGSDGRSELAYSGVVPYGSWTKLRPLLAKFSFPSVKFKAMPDVAANQERVQKLRGLYGPDTRIRMDANGGWTLEEAQRQIEAGLALNVHSYEQPLNTQQEAQMANLIAGYGEQASIMADESLVRLTDARRLVEQGRCNHFNLKLSKNGGLFNSLRIYRYARENGIRCQLGAHYGETSILSAAGAAFAACAPDLTDREGALGTFLLTEDITPQPLMIDRQGRLPEDLPPFHGWPVKIDDIKLNINSVRSDLVGF